MAGIYVAQFHQNAPIVRSQNGAIAQIKKYKNTGIRLRYRYAETRTPVFFIIIYPLSLRCISFRHLRLRHLVILTILHLTRFRLVEL